MGDSLEGIYSQEQVDEANKVGEVDLRHALLHNIRTRDIFKRDRDFYEKKITEADAEIEHLKMNLLIECDARNDAIKNWHLALLLNEKWMAIACEENFEEALGKFIAFRRDINER